MMELRFEPKQFDSRICAFLHYTIPLRDQNKYQKCILNFKQLPFANAFLAHILWVPLTRSTLLYADSLTCTPTFSHIHSPQQHDDAGIINPHLMDEEAEAQWD